MLDNFTQISGGVENDSTALPTPNAAYECDNARQCCIILNQSIDQTKVLLHLTPIVFRKIRRRNGA